MLLVVKKGHEFPFETIEDLAGKVLGVRRGSIYGDVFERGMRELLFTVNEDGNGVQRLKKLLLDRIDVALIGPGKSGLNWIINSDSMLQASRDEFVVLPVPFAVDPNYLGFAQAMNMKEFLAEFNLIIQQGHEDGTIQAIIGKYEEYTSRLMR